MTRAQEISDLLAGVTITTADNTAQLTLTSTDADANKGPVLDLYRNSGSPADADSTGRILFNGENDADEIVEYARIATQSLDVTNGSEDGLLTLDVMKDGTQRIGIEITGAEVVVNESSVDMDFRVESDNTTHALFVEGSSGNVGIGDSDPTRMLHIKALGTGVAEEATLILENEVGTTGSIGQGDQGDNAMIFTENGSESMRIHTNGSLLIGKTAENVATVGTEARGAGPLITTRDGAEPFRVNRLSSDGEIIQLRKDSSTVGSIGAKFSGRMYVAAGSSANTGLRMDTNFIAPCAADGSSRTEAINLGSTGARFQNGHFNNEVQLHTIVGKSDTNTGFDLTGSDIIKFRIAGSERARFEPSGHLQIGQTSSTTPGSGGNTTAGSTLRSVGDAYFSRDNDIALYLSRNGSDGKIASFARGGGEVGSISVGSSFTAYTTSSDRRLKSNIQNAASASNKIDAIQVRQFDWNVDGSHQDYGLIAQELEAIEPLAVTGDADSDEMMGVDYSKLVPMLIKEIQELRSRVATLEAS